MRQVAVVVALLALAGCGGSPAPAPTGPAPLTVRILASEAADHLGGVATWRGHRTAGPRPTWRADLQVLPETRVEVEVSEQDARTRFSSCPQRVRRPGVESCEKRPGYPMPVIVEARSDRRTFSWTAVSLAHGVFRRATMRITGPGDRETWIEGEDLPGATIDQLVAIVTDPDLAPTSTAAAARRARSLAS